MQSTKSLKVISEENKRIFYFFKMNGAIKIYYQVIITIR